MSAFQIKHEYPTGFLDALKEHLDENILDNIAQADSGLDAEQNRIAIDEILQSLSVPYPLEFNPKEAFELTMWWRPQDCSDLKASLINRRTNHIERAFCCACLLANTPSEYVIEPINILPRLILSTIEIDIELLPYLREMIHCAKLNHTDDSNEDMIFDEMLCRLAIILIDAHSDSTDFPEGDLAQRCQQLISAEQIYRENEDEKNMIQGYAFNDSTKRNRWLFGMSLFDQSVDDWIELTKKILLNPKASMHDKDRKWCQLLANKILGIGD